MKQFAISSFVNGCKECLVSGKNLKSMIPDNEKSKRDWSDVKLPGDVWQLDVMEIPFKNAFRYMIVGIDVFSRWPIAMPVKYQTAREIMNFLEDMIMTYGVPKKLITDCGTNFLSKEVQDC